MLQATLWRDPRCWNPRRTAVTFLPPLWNARSREPAATTYVGTLPYPFQDVCVCPPPPPVELGQLVAQLVDANDNAIVEDSKPITCP